MKTSSMKLALAPLALMLALGVSSCGAGNGPADPASAEEGEEGHGEEEDADRITISAASAEASQIVVSQAGPGALQETLSLTGRIMLQPAARAEIHAPYPGPVRAVQRNIGDAVRRGETLARVESSESLQTYSIVTPISGVVLERQTNIGDVTSEAPLFVVGDLTRLQAELNVVPRDVGRISAGQAVIITALDGSAPTQARIASVLPTADSHSQTLIARAPITVGADSALRPGMAIRANVVLASQDAAVVVPADAVQNFEGRTVVFVRLGADTYEPRDVTIGRSSRNSVEITAGLAAGESYVSHNAFLIKSQLGASAADHH
ncbi:MAG: efflux RND transporter periplasmic adaptor subunit [Hydrogenophilaceae bacterium]|jgi:cobalt-zinc-cadmium efflux system membrane fusion protein|nr:efflux RND transporter periplasmic adaptor subunit [Hydrogenophilaceae bacterium]